VANVLHPTVVTVERFDDIVENVAIAVSLNNAAIAPHFGAEASELKGEFPRLTGLENICVTKHHFCNHDSLL
jgi:hypothetical protein